MGSLNLIRASFPIRSSATKRSAATERMIIKMALVTCKTARSSQPPCVPRRCY